MAKIKIKDLPKDEKISKEEMRKVLGGWSFSVPTTNTSLLKSISLRRPIYNSEEDEEIQM